MRLTLRTLLSWKDGMVEPEAAGDLAAKVEASDVARRLVERIEEIAGRTTLSAPAPDAVGFAAAANTTAEYLDNVLPADRLVEFERVCFASESQLAETAACHEMLAAWWRQPAAELDRASRRRLLAAVRSRAGGVARSGIPGGKSRPSPPSVPEARGRRTAVRAPRPARAPASAWLLLAAAGLVLVALIGVLGWSLSPRAGKGAGRKEVALEGSRSGAPDGASEAADAPAAVSDLDPGTAPGTAADGGAGASASVSPRAALPPDAPAAPPVVPASPALAPADPRAEAFPPVDGPGPAADPAGAPADAAMPPGGPSDQPTMPVAGAVAAVPPPTPVPLADPRVPQGEALAIAAPMAPAQAGPAPPPAPAAGPPGATDAKVMGAAVLLHRPRGGAPEAWVAATGGTVLDLPVDLVAAPFGAPMVVIDDVRIVLEPGTRTVLSRDADGTPRLEVVFGRASAVRGARLGVTAGGLVGVITAGLDAPVGVEVRLERRPGVAVAEAEVVARILPTAGRIEWQPAANERGTKPAAGAEPSVVAAGQALARRSAEPGTPPVQPAGPLPEWLVAHRAGDNFDALAARALGSRLAAGTAALPALRELAVDRRVENRVAAAATLALVGEFDEAVRLLAADGDARLPESLWIRLEAAAVQPALARGPRAAEALARACVDQGPPGSADVIVRFARGFTDDELAAGGAAHLVDALEHQHLVVRRYAIKNLLEITGVPAVDQLRYRADWRAPERHEGAAWWRAQLERGRIARGADPGRAPP